MGESDVAGLFTIINQVSKEMSALTTNFYAHMETEERADATLALEINNIAAEVQKLTMKMDDHANITKAFPKNKDGISDITGHHDYHANLIVEDKTKKEEWQAVKKEFYSITLRGVLYALMFIFLLGIKDYIQHPMAPSIEQIQQHVEPHK